MFWGLENNSLMSVINSTEGVILASDMLDIVSQSSYTNDTKIDVALKGNMNNPRLVSTLYRVYVPTSICTKSKKSKKSIDLVIPHYIAPYSLAANIHIQSKQRQQMTWIKSRGSRDKTRSNAAVAIFQSSLILLICLDVEINVMDMVYCVAFGCNVIIYRKGETSPQVLFRHSSNTT